MAKNTKKAAFLKMVLKNAKKKDIGKGKEKECSKKDKKDDDKEEDDDDKEEDGEGGCGPMGKKWANLAKK